MLKLSLDNKKSWRIRVLETISSKSIKSKTRLRFAILTVFCGLLALALGVTSTYTYWGMGRIIDESSRDNIIKTQKTIIDQISNYFAPAARVAQIGSWMFLHHPQDLMAHEDLQSFMMGTLSVVPQISYLQMADTSGNYFGVRALGNQRVMLTDANRPLPHGVKAKIERIIKAGSQRLITYINAQGETIAQETVAGTLDPRQQPWFQLSQETFKAGWGDPYKNWTDGEFALTASAPLLDSTGKFLGVIGTDIPLRKISEVLARQKASRSGINFLITTSGGLLGYPVVERVMKNGQLGHISHVDEASVKQAFQQYQATHESQFTFKVDGVDYLAYFSPFPKSIHEGWLLGMVAPSDDFVGPVNRMNQEVLYISLGILFISMVLLIIFSHNISYPIEILAEQMRRLKDLNITKDPLPETRLQEIAEMADAMQLVKDSLSSFSKYVPKDLVLNLIRSGTHQHLGGEVKRLTIFFSDIENFTGISESLSSDQLMSYLSVYFNELSRIILAEHGTIDKFIGDSIMAFWGAPKEDPDQVLHGCTALLRCHEMTRESHRFVGPKRPDFRTRFSLHQADVIVGNVGSSDRMNYTIIGDGVNVANRLEGANKIYGTQILVTEPIYAQAKEHFLLRTVDKVAFQGKQNGGLIYELVMEASQLDECQSARIWIEKSEEAFAAYQNQQWQKARDLYKDVLSLKEKDPVAQVFIQRCEAYEHSPPPEWDGILRLQTK